MFLMVSELLKFMLRNTAQYFNHTADKSEECIELMYLKGKFKVGAGY